MSTPTWPRGGHRPRPRVVLGAPRVIEDDIIAHVAAIRSSDPLAPVDVLVGGVLLRPYLQRRLADVIGGIANVRFVTVGELGIRLGARALHAAGQRRIPAAAERACAAAAARAAAGYFAPVARTPGFAGDAARLLREFREEGVGLDELESAAAAIESPRKAADLTELYARYLALRAGWFDGVDALADGDLSDHDGVELIAYGVWQLGAVVRTRLAALGECVPLTVYLPCVDDEADAAHQPLRAWLDGLGAETVRLPSPAPASAPLPRLQASLFAPGAPIAPDRTVRLLTAPDPVSEVRAVARQCLRWARDGIPFREMAVVYRQAETYRPLVESVFAEAGIPVYLDDGPSVAHRPIGRRVLALLDLLDSPLRRREVMAFLADGALPAAMRARFDGAPVLAWDELSREAGIVAGAAQWRDRLGLLREEAIDHGRGRAAVRRAADCQALIAFIDALADVIEARPHTATWSGVIDYLCEAIAAYIDGAEPVVAHIRTLGGLDDIAPAESPAHVLGVVRDHVRAMTAHDLGGAAEGAFGLRGVNILDANQMRHLAFGALAVVGLTERSFPPPPRQDPLLLDDEREALNARTGRMLPLRGRGPDDEALQFAMAVWGARERLLMSVSRADEPGKSARLPSAFFRQAVSAIAGRPVGVGELDEAGAVERLPAARLGAGDPDDALTAAERDRTLLEADRELGRAVLRELEPGAERADALRSARWTSTTLTPFDGTFGGPTARSAAAKRAARASAVTKLERYAHCPMRFYFADVLGLEPLDEPDEVLRVSPLDRGSAVHAILETFIGSLGAAGADGLRDAGAAKRLAQIATRELDGLEARGRTGAPLLWRLDRDTILDDLRGWLAHEVAMPTVLASRELEVAFGGGAPPSSRRRAPAPLVIDVPGHGLAVRGRIDRLEHDADRFVVIDYKTGRGPRTADDALDGGRALQLPIYLLAAATLLGRDWRHGRAEYQVVSRLEGYRRITFDGAGLAARYDQFADALRRIADGMAEGDFHAEPGDACRVCDFAGLCDAERMHLRACKQDDPRIRRFAELRAIA